MGYVVKDILVYLTFWTKIGLVEELEDVELKCTRLMSSTGEHCGWPQHNG